MTKFITAIGKQRVYDEQGEVKIVRPGDLIDAESSEGIALIAAGLAMEVTAAPSPADDAGEPLPKKARKGKAVD